MDKKLIAPFIFGMLLLVFDLMALIQGIVQHQIERIALAGLALVGIIAYLYFLLLCNNTNRLRPIRVRSRR